MIFTIVTTIVTIVLTFFDIDRSMFLKMANAKTMIKSYSMKPKNKTRTVGVINCKDEPLNEKTLKSILDQSVRLDDLTVETRYPKAVDSSLSSVLTVHAPGTAWLREPEKDTLIINIENGREYPYDWIERTYERASGQASGQASDQVYRQGNL